MSQTEDGSYKGTLASYIAGFVFSIILTVGAYLLAVNDALKENTLIAAIVGMAILQLLVQLIFFLHLSDEPKPRSNLQVAGFAGLVLVIIVFGSLWIMNHLNYHQMTPEETNSYIEDEEAIHR